ncbi:MAG: helix-turn-helix domain-containing protein [Bacteroidetes bacterium]|jgi:transposase-like protein|nr:helix-turn-helix domain-containing protein [Bacteroidota bacterium]MBT7039205.1 helix-turn-helix domain-containing protein [Bacteroidota bacterium]MBT7826260.1 helix-turn-helix domain-containing protein [Bacteroidota bacterium]
MTGFISYNNSLKIRVVKEVLSGHLTQTEANRKYGIRGHSTILKWIRKFEKQESFVLNMTSTSKTDNQGLIDRIKELEHQLENQKLLAEGLSAMIDIAEAQLNTSIRKKSDTKQSR